VLQEKKHSEDLRREGEGGKQGIRMIPVVRHTLKKLTIQEFALAPGLPPPSVSPRGGWKERLDVFGQRIHYKNATFISEKEGEQ